MEKLAILPRRLGDLAGELAGRRQDQDPRPANPRLQGGRDALQRGQHEGGGLAGAGLGGGKKIAAGEGRRDRRRLNRGRRRVTGGVEGFENEGVEREIGE
jgi:hypothetical protein